MLRMIDPSRVKTHTSRRKAGAITRTLAVFLLAASGLTVSAQAQSAFPGSDSHIYHNGRTETPGVMVWTGHTVTIKFTGSTSISANFQDNWGYTVDFACFLDGARVSVPALIGLNAGNGQDITLATGLNKNAPHTLFIYRTSDTEYAAWINTVTLDSGGQLLSPDAPSSRRIEYYGDSVTSGGSIDPGNANPDINDDGQWLQNNYDTFGATTARNLGAEARFVSHGGAGLLSSFLPSTNDSATLSNYWHKARWDSFTTDPSTVSEWNFSLWQPQAVVIAIGHNDIYRGVAESNFITGYKNLVSGLQAKYPGVKIFCMNTSIDDASPSGGQYTFYNDTFNAVAGPNVYTKTFAGDGHSGHPRAADHVAMANIITPWIGGILGWTTGGGGTEAAYNGPHNIPGTLQAEDYDTGGEGTAYHDTDAGNNGGAYRSDNVDIETTTDTGGGYDVGWTAAGEYLKYTVNVAAAGTYTVGFRVAAIASGNTFHLENSTGTNLTGTVTCPNTGGWQAWQTVNATVTLPAGTQVLKLVEDTGGYNINSLTFTAAGGGSGSGLTLTGTPGDAQAALSWTPYSGATSYRVKISTTSGSGYSWVVTGWGSTNYTDTGLTDGTTYYFVVAALDGSGNELANSNQVAVTPASAGTTTDIAAGGAGVGSFVADTDYSGGNTYNTSDTINTSAAGAAPAGVYQSERYGTFTYTVPVSTPPAGGSYTVNLHFAELWHGISSRGNDGGTGQRLFNVSINGTSVLSNFDIYATAGGADTAVVETFTGYQPNGSGNLVISFSPASGSPDQSAKVDGIEVFDPAGGKVAPASPTGVKAVVRKGQVALSWAGVSGATSYSISRGTATGKEASYKSGVQASWFGDTSVTSGTTYYYKVVAVNAKGQSAAGTEVKATAQ